MKYRDLLRKAAELGSQLGHQSAAWYWDRTEPTKADYQRVLKGINDGDPEILDTFVSGSLSGEFADDMTPTRLYEDLGVKEYQLRNWEQTHHLDDLCAAFEQAFNSAYESAVVDQCREYLESEVTITINARITEVTPETLRQWTSQVEEAAARHQEVSIDDVTVEEPDSVEAHRF